MIAFNIKYVQSLWMVRLSIRVLLFVFLETKINDECVDVGKRSILNSKHGDLL